MLKIILEPRQLMLHCEAAIYIGMLLWSWPLPKCRVTVTGEISEWNQGENVRSSADTFRLIDNYYGR